MLECVRGNSVVSSEMHAYSPAPRRFPVVARPPMLRLIFKRRAPLFTWLVLIVTTIAFAILVSVASSHLHIVAQDNNACAACTALEDSFHKSPPPQDARPAVVVNLAVAALPQLQRLGVTPTLPPPSCGPPAVA
jgi:hypothetical protein